MPVRIDSGSVRPFQSVQGRAVLEQQNPELPRLIKENPGVGVLVQRLEANGLIREPRPGDKKTDVEMALWTHSKQSGGMPVEPFHDVIVAYEYDPNGRDLTIGGGGWCKGKVVGVFRLDQFAFASEAEAKKHEPSLKVKEFAPGKFVHISDDQTFRGSYEWKPMKLDVHGEEGKPFTLRWAIVGLGAQGNVMGGGYSGWEGREADGVFGKPLKTEMPDH